MLTRARFVWLLPVPVILGSLWIGPADGLSAGQLWAWIFGQRLPPELDAETVRQIVLAVRLPRILLSFLVGGALTISGSSLQVLARNPLVSPDILGLSSGAAFGAALALSVSWLPVQPSAFVCALVASALTYAFAAGRRGVSVVSLVLSGVIVGGIFTAALTVVQMVSDPLRLQSIVHWTLGNLHTASWSKLRSAAAPVLLGAGALIAMSWRLNVLALGDDETRAVGRDPRREKLYVLIPAALVASAAVAVAGVVSMVGLVVPHMLRLLLGPDNVRCIPASLAAGGAFLLLVDDLARAATSYEIPIGVLTTLIGGPFFLYLLRRSEGGYDGP